MIKKIFAVATLICICFTFLGCTTYNDSHSDNSIFMYRSKLLNRCFIGEIKYSKGESAKIVLPSEYDGHTVTQLGGYVGTGYPHPFGVLVDIDEFYPEANGNAFNTNDLDYLEREYGDRLSVFDMKFYVVLPDNLKSVKITFGDYYQCAEVTHSNGNTVLYAIHPTYHLEIAESNKHFYTKDGKLYDKKTDELIESFAYAESKHPDIPHINIS